LPLIQKGELSLIQKGELSLIQKGELPFAPTVAHANFSQTTSLCWRELVARAYY